MLIHIFVFVGAVGTPHDGVRKVGHKLNKFYSHILLTKLSHCMCVLYMHSTVAVSRVAFIIICVCLFLFIFFLFSYIYYYIYILVMALTKKKSIDEKIKIKILSIRVTPFVVLTSSNLVLKYILSCFCFWTFNKS